MEHIYIVSYKSHEGPDFDAFREKEFAVTCMEAQFKDAVSMLSEQGYNTETIKSGNTRKVCVIGNPEIYYEWEVFETPLM